MGARPTIWLTGLSRSGKSTIAEGLAAWFADEQRPAQILDGRDVRDAVGDFFGYSKGERIKVSRVLAVMARLLATNGVTPIVTSITPYQDSRDFNRQELDPYLEIYVECSVDTAMQRDDTGIYRRAVRGDIQHFIGVDDPYEVPRSPDLVLSTERETPEQSIRRAVEFIRASTLAGSAGTGT